MTEQIIDERIRQGDLLTINIYSALVASQVVGDVWANLVRVITPKGGHGEVISENFFHLFYNVVRVTSFNTIKILLRGDTDRPIPFFSGWCYPAITVSKRFLTIDRDCTAFNYRRMLYLQGHWKVRLMNLIFPTTFVPPTIDTLATILGKR